MIGTFIDLGVGAIILIAVIVGLAVGFSRQFSRPLVGLIAIFGAIGLTAVIYTLVSPLSFYGDLEVKATGLFASNFYTEEATDAESLAAILDSGYLRILTSSAEAIWSKMVITETTTLGAYFGKLLVRVVSQFLMWVVFYLAIKYLLFGIKYLMTKISRVVVFKSLDRIFGLVWSLAITYIVVVSIVLTTGELVLGKFFEGIAETATNYIRETSLLKFFHNINVIGSFIADLLHWPLFAV